jgi:inactive STAND
MTDLLDRNPQKSHSELQKAYDFMTEEIQFLQHSERTDDLSPRERFRLKKQIEEAKEERALIEQQLQEHVKAYSGEDLYRTLLRLGFRSQVRLFRTLIEAKSVAAFLIHGLPDYGQRWLLNRLVVQYAPYYLQSKIVVVYASRKVRKNDVSAFWRDVAGRFNLVGDKSPSEIGEHVCQSLKNYNVLLVFHEVSRIPEPTLCDLIDNFWLPLVSKVQDQSSQSNKFKLLMFLIDYEGCVENWEVPFADNLNSNRQSQFPLKLPIITELSDNDLVDWMELEYDKLPPTLTTPNINNATQAILADSVNGVPEEVLKKICTDCGYDWYEESEKWQKIK